MRDFLALDNLYRSLCLGAVVTLMSLPRLALGHMPLTIFLPATFCVMVLTAGAILAWGKSAGLCGAFPPARRQLAAAAAALAVTVLMLPPRWLWLDPHLREAFTAARATALLALAYPTSTAGIAAALLWSAGFEALFFHAAPVALFARATHRAWIGILAGVAFRTWATAQQLAHYDITTHTGLFLAGTLGCALLGCVLFARGGLLPVMLFGAGLEFHLLLPER